MTATTTVINDTTTTTTTTTTLSPQDLERIRRFNRLRRQYERIERDMNRVWESTQSISKPWWYPIVKPFLLVYRDFCQIWNKIKPSHFRGHYARHNPRPVNKSK